MAESEGQVVELEGEVLAEEDADFDPEAESRITVLAERWQSATNLPVLRDEVRTAAIAVAGGALAGAATVAAVRAVSGSSGRSPRKARRLRRKGRPDNIVATRSFLVDVHLLGR